MARYDRMFLVPYLNDICTLQLSKKKIADKIKGEQQKIEQIKEDAIRTVAMPEMEALGKESSWRAILLCLGAYFLAACFCIAGFLNFDYFFICLLVALILACSPLFIVIGDMKRCKKENVAIQLRNEERVKLYERQKVTALNNASPFVNIVEGRIAFFEEEIQKIDKLLDELYSARVIPRWYRDLYPAVYLDDWFSNGRSDDLDMALNTFVLEEIKDKLDVIIRNQGEALINQRIMIANQHKAMEQRERHHQELMCKLDAIQTTNEERNSYLQMINANTATNAFYVQATYLRDI